MTADATVDMRPLAGAEAYLVISDLERASSRAELAKLRQVVVLGGVRPGACVLDAGAGQGWHALALAGSHQVIGLDRSERLVAEARTRSLALPAEKRPAFVHSPIEGAVLPERAFDLAYSLNTSLGHGSAETDARALARLARVLLPGAALVLETLSIAEADEAEPDQRVLGGTTLTVAPCYEPATSVFTEEQCVRLAGGRLGTFSYRVRAYDPADLEHLAREAGFSRVTVLPGLDGRPGGSPSPAAIVARTPPSPRFHSVVTTAVRD